MAPRAPTGSWRSWAWAKRDQGQQDLGAHRLVVEVEAMEQGNGAHQPGLDHPGGRDGRRQLNRQQGEPAHAGEKAGAGIPTGLVLNQFSDGLLQPHRLGPLAHLLGHLLGAFEAKRLLPTQGIGNRGTVDPPAHDGGDQLGGEGLGVAGGSHRQGRRLRRQGYGRWQTPRGCGMPSPAVLHALSSNVNWGG
jgi:hypothetical protein